MNCSQARSKAFVTVGFFLPNSEAVNALRLSAGGIGTGRGVNRFEGRGDGLAVAVGHEPQRVADQMHHTRLHRRLRPGRRDRFGEPGQPVATHDEHVLDPAIGQIRAHRRPERRSLVGLDPDPQDMLDPVHIDAYGDMSGLVAGVAAVFDLHDHRVEIDHRIERLQRAALPGEHLIGDLIDDLGDRLVRDLGADRRSEMKLDVPQ